MGLFGKKKQEIEAPVCTCNGDCRMKNAMDEATKEHSDIHSGRLNIKVLGAGCPSCHRQYETVQAAVKRTGIDADVEYITDLTKVMEYGVMAFPAIVINEKVVVKGRILKIADVMALLQESVP